MSSYWQVPNGVFVGSRKDSKVGDEIILEFDDNVTCSFPVGKCGMERPYDEREKLLKVKVENCTKTMSQIKVAGEVSGEVAVKAKLDKPIYIKFSAKFCSDVYSEADIPYGTIPTFYELELLPSHDYTIEKNDTIVVYGYNPDYHPWKVWADDAPTLEQLSKMCKKCGTVDDTSEFTYKTLNCHSCGRNRLDCRCDDGFTFCPDHPIMCGITEKLACTQCGKPSKFFNRLRLMQNSCHICGDYIWAKCCYGHVSELCPEHPVHYVKPKPPCPDCGKVRCSKDPYSGKCVCPQCCEEAHPGEMCLCPGCGGIWHCGPCPGS